MSRKAVETVADREPSFVARLDCPYCGAVIRVTTGADCPVKLPSGCPCCLRMLTAYTWEAA
jgi:hypothetical protein